MRAIRKLWSHRAGATAIEYGLILALIALSALGAIQLFASRSNDIWSNVSTTASSNMNS